MKTIAGKRYFPKDTPFFIGLAVFFLVVFLSPGKPVYFGAFLAASFFFFIWRKSIRDALLYGLVLSLFFEQGIAASLFLLEPADLGLGSGFWITPMTVFVMLLTPFSLMGKLRVKKVDYVVVAFLVTAFASFLFFPYQNVLFGLIRLGEVILVYFLLRINLTRENIRDIVYLLIFVLFLQLTISTGQLFLARPVGLLVETISVSTPFGFTAPEEQNLFRITGAFGHPNLFASFLLATIPFLFFLKIGKKKVYLTIMKILLVVLSLTALFFTYSRVAWGIALVLGIGWFAIHKETKFNFRRVLVLIVSFLAGIFLLFPFLETRIRTVPQAFSEFGSFGVRIKLVKEAVNIIVQYPLTGVGLNQSFAYYFQNPVTDLFEKIAPSGFYRIHNTLLEIAAEIGLPGMIFFLLFLALTSWYYLKGKKSYMKDAAFLGLLGLFGISMLNPFLHSSQFRLFFLLAAIILV